MHLHPRHTEGFCKESDDPLSQHMENWLPSMKTDTETRVQILDETDCISHNTDTIGKRMNLIILPS